MAHTRKRVGATVLGLSAIAAIAFVPATPAQADPDIKDVKVRVDRLYHEAEAAQERLHDATRETRVVGTAVPNFFRRPYGEGWALVGDAGYNKDFITAQGIHDAFRDAELCATALDDTLAGRRSFESALSGYQARRDEQVLPMYEFTTELAALAPPPPQMQQLLTAVSRSQEAMDGFARVAAGVTSPAEFFSDENAARILAAAA